MEGKDGIYPKRNFNKNTKKRRFLSEGWFLWALRPGNTVTSYTISKFLQRPGEQLGRKFKWNEEKEKSKTGLSIREAQLVDFGIFTNCLIIPGTDKLEGRKLTLFCWVRFKARAQNTYRWHCIDPSEHWTVRSVKIFLRWNSSKIPGLNAICVLIKIGSVIFILI